jgi:hypothetical protein
MVINSPYGLLVYSIYVDFLYSNLHIELYMSIEDIDFEFASVAMCAVRRLQTF